LRICSTINDHEFYYESAKEMDEVFDHEIWGKLLKWPHKSGLKNNEWRNKNRKAQLTLIRPPLVKDKVIPDTQK